MIIMIIMMIMDDNDDNNNDDNNEMIATHQVLHTLSRLSQTPRSTSTGQNGFPQSQAQVKHQIFAIMKSWYSSPTDTTINLQSPSRDEEEIYRGLEDLVTEDQYTDFYQKHLGGGNFGQRYESSLNTTSEFTFQF